MAMPSNYVRAILYTANEHGKNAQSVLWYQSNVNPSPETAGAETLTAAVNLSSAFAPKYLAFLAVDSRFIGVQVSWSIDGAVYNAFSGDGGGQGSIAGDSLPNYAAAVIQKRTALPGKTGRGRIYVGPVAEGLTDDQALTAAGANALTDIALQMMVQQNTGGTYVLLPCHLHGANLLEPLTGTRGLLQLGMMSRRRVRPTF